MYALALICGLVQIISECSESFSDWFNRYIGAFARGLHAWITNFIPFSLAECLIVFIPVLAVVVIVGCFKRLKRSQTSAWRYIASLAGFAAWMYAAFVVTTAVAYNGTTLADKLGLEQSPVSADELKTAAE